MKTRTPKRVFCMFLAIVMSLSLLPTSVFAQEYIEEPAIIEDVLPVENTENTAASPDEPDEDVEILADFVDDAVVEEPAEVEEPAIEDANLTATDFDETKAVATDVESFKSACAYVSHWIGGVTSGSAPKPSYSVAVNENIAITEDTTVTLNGGIQFTMATGKSVSIAPGVTLHFVASEERNAYSDCYDSLGFCYSMDNVSCVGCNKDNTHCIMCVSMNPAKAQIGTNGYESLDAALAAVQNGETIKLIAGTFACTNDGAIANVEGKTFTIEGVGDTTIVNIGDGTAGGEGDCDYRFTGANVTFKNMKLVETSGNANYLGFAHIGKATFDTVTFVGRTSYWGNDCTIKNSVFDQADAYDYCLWTWGCASMTIQNTTFNTQGKAIKLYGGANTALTVENCKFNSNGNHSGADKPAIAVANHNVNGNYTLTITNCTQSGFVKGVLGDEMWGTDTMDDIDPNKTLVVTVNGTQVYPEVAKIATLTKDGTKVDDYATVKEALAAYAADGNGNYVITIKDSATAYGVGDVIVYQVTGKTLSIQAETQNGVTLQYEHDTSVPTSNAIFNIHGNSGGEYSLTFSGINFNLGTGTVSAIRAMQGGSESTDSIFKDISNPNGRYAHNITCSYCTFTDTDASGSTVIDAKAGTGAGHFLVDHCTVTKVENLLSDRTADFGTDDDRYGFKISNSTVTGVNRFLNNQAGDATTIIDNCTVDSFNDYSIRTAQDGTSSTLSITNSTITNTCPASKATTGGIVVCRQADNVYIANSVFVKPDGFYDVQNLKSKAVVVKSGSYLVDKLGEGKKEIGKLSKDVTLTSDDNGYNFANLNFYQDATDANLWHIANAAGWVEFVKAVNVDNNTFEGKTIQLDADIDMSTYATVDPVGIMNDINFMGTFDGNEKTISNINIYRLGNNGTALFGQIYAPAVIKNLNVANATVTADRDSAGDKSGAYVGGIAGHGYGTITNCTFSGTIYGGHQIGGIAGSGGFTITGCTFDGAIVSTRYWALGGIIGNCQDGGEISNNTAKGTITATYSGTEGENGKYMGGIVADAIYNTQVISGNNSQITLTYNGEKVNNPITGAYNDDETMLDDFSAISNNIWDKNIYNFDKYLVVRDTVGTTTWIANYNGATIKAVAQIGETLYATLADAIAAVPANNTENVTIELLSKVVLDSALAVNKNYVTIDGKNFTISAADTGFDDYKVGGAKQKYGGMNLIAVSGNNVTMKNMTVDIKDYRGMSCCTTVGGSNVTYDHITYTGRGSGHYYGYASNGLITFSNCTVNTKGYGIHLANEGTSGDKVVIENCSVNGWNSFGTCESVTVTDTHFGNAWDGDGEVAKNGNLAVFRPYCPATLTNCTFSAEYAMGGTTGYKYVGLDTGAAVTVTLNNCTVEGIADITSIVNYALFESEEAANGSVFAFDATGDAENGYTGGTFVAKDSDKINFADGYKVFEKDTDINLWTVKKVDEIIVNPTGEEGSKTAEVSTDTDSHVDPNAIATVVPEEERVNVAVNTEVSGVELTKPAEDQASGSGLQTVIQKACDENAAVANLVKATDADKEINVKVDVEVVPTTFNKTEHSVAFKLTPKATVTVNTVDSETGAVIDTETAENVAVDNSMIDQTQNIKVSIYTGFKPTSVTHKEDEDKGGAIIEVFTGDQFAYDEATGVTTVTIHRFSVLNADQDTKTYVASIGANKYETLAAAIAAATEGQTINLLADVTLTEALGENLNGKNITIASGTHKLTLNGVKVGFETGSTTSDTLALTGNCTVGDAFIGQDTAELTGRTYKLNVSGTGALKQVYLRQNGELNISGEGTAVTGDYQCIYGALNITGGATYTVNGANFYVSGRISSDKMAKDKAVITVDGSTLDFTKTYALEISDGLSSNPYKGSGKLVLKNNAVATGTNIWMGPNADGSLGTIAIDSTDSTITLSGYLTIGAGDTVYLKNSKITTNAFTNNGTVTVDMTGATENSYTIIDYTGADTKALADYGTVTLTGSNNYRLDVVENDLVAVKKDPVAKNTTTNTEYCDLAEALNDCKAGETVQLLGDLNLTGVEWTPVVKFAGTFDGAGKTITGLTVSGTSSVGMFASLNGATVKDLTITGATVTATDNKSGILAAEVASGAINNVTVTNSAVTSTGEYVGALFGIGYSDVDNCTVTGNTIKGKDQVGAAIGYMWVGSIDNCTVTGNKITSEYRAGGLIGKVQFAKDNIGPVLTDKMTVNGNTISAEINCGMASGGIAGQIMGDDARFEIKNNTINVPYATNPIATLRDKQSISFTGKLAQNITGNWWTNETYNDDSFKYTNVGLVPAQIIYRGIAKIGYEHTYQTLQAAVDAAVDGDTIVMLANVAYDTFNTNNTAAAVVVPGTKDITLDLNGKTITGTSSVNGAAYLIYNKGYLTIKDSAGNGKITFSSSYPDPGYGYGTSTILNRGVLNVESGTIENTTVNGASYAVDNQTQWYDDIIPVVFNMKGGELICTTGDAGVRQSSSLGEQYKKDGQIVKNYVNVSGGTITGDIWVQNSGDSYSDLTISGGTITGKVYDNKGTTIANLNYSITGGNIGSVSSGGGKEGFISGGTFKTPIDPKYCAEGFEPKDNGDGTYGVQKVAIAKIGETKYNDLAKALTDCKAGETVELINDVDLSDVEWTPVAGFAGTFDGKGYTITGLTVTGTSGNLGLIGSATSGAVIRNLTVSGASITGSGSKAGVVVGGGFQTTIENVTVTGSTVDVDGAYVGGIVGGNYTDVINCVVTDTSVTGKEQVGGIVGYACGTSVEGCTVNGTTTVTATAERAGGLIGKAQAGDGALVVNNNSVTASVSAPDMAGGICAQLMGAGTEENTWASYFQMKDNYVNVTFTGTAPATNPIGNLRNGQETVFTSTLGNKITGNWWENVTSTADSFTYTNVGDTVPGQVIYRGVATVTDGTTSKAYKTFDAAIAAAKNDETIKLIDNITVSKRTEIDGKSNITLDLNGKTVTFTTNGDNDLNNEGLIRVLGGSDVTVTGNGTMTYTGSAEKWCAGYCFMVYGDSTLTIENGTFKAVCTVVQAGGGSPNTAGTVNIKGGTFQTDGQYEGQLWTLNKKDNTSSVISVTGGTFVGYDPANGKTESPNDNFVAEGYKSVETSGNWTVVPCDFVAENTTTGTKYETLADAVAAAKNDETVQLLADCDVTARVEVADKAITLDLNGKTVSYTGAQLNSGIILVHNGAGLTVTDSATGGKIASGTNAYAAIALTKAGDDATKTASLTVKGGTLEGNYYAITGNGSRNNTAITIEGGTITATDSEATGIYNPQSGTISMTGGTITAANGIYMKSGTITTLSGGTINATGEKGEYGFNGSGYESTGDALVVDNCNYPGGRPTVTVNGTTLTSANGFQIGAYYSAPETGISDIYSTVNNLTAPAGYDWCETTTAGTYKLAKAVAQIGSNKYTSLADAVAAAQSGDTVTLLADIDLGDYGATGITIDTAKNFTLDLAGKKITGNTTATGTSQMIYNKGTLVIKDSIGGGSIVSGASPAWQYGDDYDFAGSYASNTIRNEGNITLQSGRIFNNTSGYAAYGIDNYNSGVVSITGGEIETAFAAAVRMFYGTGSVSVSDTAKLTSGNRFALQLMGGTTTATISGGTFTSNSTDPDYKYALCTYSAANAEITVTGGTFNGAIDVGDTSIAISGGTFSNAVPAEYCAEGFIPQKNLDGTYGVKEGSYVAQNGDVKYETLADAIAAAQSGDTVTLLDDVTVDSTQAIAKDVTLDLNGKTVTGAGTRVFHVKSGTLNLTGSGKVTVTEGITGASSVIRVGDGSDFTVTKANGVTAGLTVGENVTVESAYSYAVSAFGGATNENIVINGTISGTSAFATSGNEKVGGTTPTLTLNATAKMLATDNYSYAMYLPAPGDYTINGTVTGSGGICTKAGDLNIAIGSTAVISATGTPGMLHPEGYGNGAATKNYAIAVENHANYGGPAAVSINGGTVNGTVTIYDDAKDPITDASKMGTITSTNNKITTSADLEWCETTTAGTYKLAKAVAQIGSVKYASLADAIAAAKSGETVKLLADVTENVTIASDDNIVLDLGGFTLNGKQTANTPTILNNGTVEIKNGTVTRTGEGSSSHYVVENNGTMTLNATVTGSAGASLIRNNAQNAVLNITDGTYTQEGDFITLKNDLGTVNVSGGTFSTNANKAVLNNWSTMTISGGTFTGQILNGAYDTDNNVLTISGGTFNTNKVRTYLGNGMTQAPINISGGKFTKAIDFSAEGTAEASQASITGGLYAVTPAAANVATGKAVVPNTDEATKTECPYTIGDAVAQIGTKGYATLAEALKAAQNNDTIEVLEGTWGAEAVGTLTTAEAGQVRYKSLTIQPADGATVTFTSQVYLGYDDSSTANASMTVKNLKFDGASLQISNYNVVTVDSCTFVNGTTATNGTLVIQDACCKNHKTTDTYPASQITVTNCSINGSNTGASGIRLRNSGNVTLTGNTIENSEFNGILFETNGSCNNTVAKTVSVTNNTITEWNSTNTSEKGRAIRAAFTGTTGSVESGALTTGTTITFSNNTFRKAAANLGLDKPDFMKITGAANATVDINNNDWNDELKTTVSGNSAYYTVDGKTPALTSVVTTKKDAVAKIANTTYESLADAINAVTSDAVTTITLLKNVEKANGITVPEGRNIIVDFGGFTYSVEKPGAGSTGTATNAFQLLKNSTIVFKNGTINCTEANKDFTWAKDDTVKGVATIIQNYANLTLEGMTIDGTNIAHNGDNVRYIVSNNCGDTIINNSKIIATGNDFAFDTYKDNSYTIPTVSVTGTSEITGKIELGGGNLALEAGTLNGTLVVPKAGIGNGVVTKTATFTATAPSGYVWTTTEEENVSRLIKKVAPVAPPTSTPTVVSDAKTEAEQTAANTEATNVTAEIKANTNAFGDGSTNIKTVIDGTIAKGALDNSEYIKIDLTKLDIKTETVSEVAKATLNKVEYSVEPKVTIETKDKDGNVTSSVERTITNEELAAKNVAITFRLPVPKEITATTVGVTHVSAEPDKIPTERFACEVKGEGNNRYIELTVTHFSTFTIEAPVTYTYALNASPAAGGKIVGTGSSDNYTGELLKAVANDGYKFVRWSLDDGTGKPSADVLSTDVNYTYIPQSNTALYAVFEVLSTTVKAEVTIDGQGSFKVNEVAQKSVYTQRKPIGQEMTIEYTGSDTFLYWKNTSGNIVTRNPYFAFTVRGNTTYYAVTVPTDASSGAAYVTYRTTAPDDPILGQILSSGYYQLGTNDTFSVAGNAPFIPTKFGTTFVEWWVYDSNDVPWSATDAKVTELIKNGNMTNINLYPYYRSKGTYSASIFLYVDGKKFVDYAWKTSGDIDLGNSVVFDLGDIIEDGIKYYFDKVTIGEKVYSTSSKFSYFPLNLSDKGTVVFNAYYTTTQPSTKTSNVSIEMSAPYQENGGDWKQSFTSNYSINAEVSQIASTGFLFATRSADESELYYANKMNVKCVEWDNIQSSTETMVLHLTKVDAAQKVSVRAFVILTDGTAVYSEVVKY